MNKKIILRKFLLCQIFLFSLFSTDTFAQTGSSDDFDGDGVVNSSDIDDDNDGVPDVIESSNCFYTVNEWNMLAKPASAVIVSSELTNTVGNFNQLLDGINNVTAVTFSNTPAQPIQNANVYLFTFSQAVKLDALYLKFNTVSQFGGTTKIQGSNTNNGSDWVDLSAAIAATTGNKTTANGNVSVTNAIKYPVTLNTATAYKYIRITGAASSNIAAQNASEVYFDFNIANYIASFYPKATCSDANIDSDGMLPQFDLDSDGDGASDALEAGATTSNTANFQFSDIDTNNDGLVDAVDTNNDGKIEYSSTYNPNALNNHISPFLTEICNDGIDNDADGFIDTYDSDCSPTAACASSKTVNNFQVQKKNCSSTGSYNNYQTPMVADVDRDGIPDIITFNDANNSISVLNSTTLVPKFSVPNPDGNFGVRPNSLAVGQLDGSGYLEITYVSSNGKLIVMRHNGTSWQSFISAKINTAVIGNAYASAYTNGTAIADFDQDGTPEIYLGNQIYTVDFSCTASPCITNVIDGMTVGSAFGSIGVPGGGFSFAYDILPTTECSLCSGLELIAGNQIYAVDVANGQAEVVRNFTDYGDGNPDGPSAIADINLDGLVDVVVSNLGGSIYAWTPQTNTLVKDWAGNGGGQRPLPFIANVYNDDLADDGIINGSTVNYPEIIVLVGTQLTAYNIHSNTPLFTVATSDSSSATSMVAFDFNGDGNKEIVYRDMTDLRIMYGGPLAYAPPGVDANRNYATFSCTSGTGWEHPIVADIDANGEANIVGSCGSSICVFSSVNFPWMPARPIWNQLSYNNVNVNDDGSIPVHQQNILSSFNGPSNQVLNEFNTQLNPLEKISPQGQMATPDISVSGASIINPNPDESADCSNLQIQYQITNTGNAAMANNIYVYVYDKDPRTQSTASLIYQTTSNQNIPAGATITQNLQFGVPSSSIPIDNLYIAVNTNPDMTVLVDADDFEGSYPECNYSNNIFEFALPPCSDIDNDGITDGLDIDDDNDGTVDAIESPDCFYTTAEAVVPVKVSTGVKNSTVNSAAVIAGNDIPTMHDGVTTNVTASNHGISPNQLDNTSVVIYKIQYPTSISLTQMTVYTDTANWGTGSFAVLEGSNDDVNYTAVSAPVAISAETHKVWPVTLNTSDLYRYYRIRVSMVGSTQPAFSNFEITGTINPATYITSAHPKPITCMVDTDADGVPNHHDLDSDGDGCPDAKESGVSSNSGASGSMSASGGSIYSGGIAPGTANAYVGNGTSSQYGANGYFNGIETSTESGVYNGNSTYFQYALDNNLNFCLDADSDGISDVIDIDDDNDGILDTIEDNCTLSITSKSGVTVTKPATINYNFNGSKTLANLVDGTDSNVYVIYNPTGTLENSEWFRVEFPAPKVLTQWEIGHYSNQTLFGTSSIYKVQASNDGNRWTDLTGNLTYKNNGSGQSTQPNSNIANFPQNTIAYKYYRYFGITPAAAGNGWATEFYFKEKICNYDIDNDGIPNRLDLDSDSDGCSDAIESGVSSNSGASGFMSPSGGNIYSGGIAPGTANAYVGNGTSSQYGANGYFNGIETSSESGVYNGTYTYSNAIDPDIAECSLACYRPAVTSGMALDTKQGITSLQRAGKDNSNWPMVRKGAWTALESKTKGFVMNRLSTAQINAIPADNLVEGMMVYNIDSDCLYINTDGTATGWRCFNTQACP